MPCVSPREITVNGIRHTVGCTNCQSCKAGRVRDWVGRALAESKFAVGANMITLTYGKTLSYGEKIDHPGAKKLQYSDFQKWAKRVRKAGYKFRYIVAGEYGTLKGRAHWHVIVFWQNKIPPYSREACWRDDPFWKDGHTNWGDVDANSVRYVAKYLHKDADDEASDTIFKASLQPLLGAPYFDEWARRHVDAGLPLKLGRKYTIDGVLQPGKDPSKAKLWEYWMSEAAVKYVCESYMRQWRAKWGDREPECPVVARHLDRQARERALEAENAAAMVFSEDEAKRIRQRQRENRRVEAVPPDCPPPEGKAEWSESLNAYVARGETKTFYWNGRAGRLHQWSERIIAEPVAAAAEPTASGPLRLGRKLKAEGQKDARRKADAARYHVAMLETRIGAVAEILKRSRGDPPF